MTDQELKQANRIIEKGGPGSQPSALSGPCPLAAVVLVLVGRYLKSDWGTQATPGPYRRHWGLEQWGARGRARGNEQDQLATPEPRSWTEGGRASTSGCWYPGSDPCVMEEALFPSRWSWSPWRTGPELFSLPLPALGLHLPDPPLENKDEGEEWATAWSKHHSVPMDPGSRTDRTDEKESGWSTSVCTRGSCLDSENYQLSSRKMWYNRSSKQGRIACLEVTILRVAVSTCIPNQNQHHTEYTLVEMSISILPI